MSFSSLMGAERAAAHSSGRSANLLGPSDNSDSGSDAMGSSEARADSDAGGSGERSSVDLDEVEEGADIMPDRVVSLGPLGEMRDFDEEDGGALGELDFESADAGELVDLDEEVAEASEGELRAS